MRRKGLTGWRNYYERRSEAPNQGVCGSKRDHRQGLAETHGVGDNTSAELRWFIKLVGLRDPIHKASNFRVKRSLCA